MEEDLPVNEKAGLTVPLQSHNELTPKLKQKNICDVNADVDADIAVIATLFLNFHTGQLIWLVGCFGFNGPLRQYFSLYRAISQREGEREKKR